MKNYQAIGGLCFSNSPYNKLRYDELLYNYLNDRQQLIFWLQEFGLISRKRSCVMCGSLMKLVETGDRFDGFKSECRKSG